MIKFDSNGQIQEYTLILARRNHSHLGQLVNVGEIVSKVNMNAANEISFTVYKQDNGNVERLWDEITDFKYIYVKELNEYYEITVDVNDEDYTYKSIVGTSACEAELSQSYIYGMEINTEIDIAREEYKTPTIFYNPTDPKSSLLNRALSKMPHYSIKHVDSTIEKIQRTFSCDGEDVYSFLTETVAPEIGCLFTFDSTDRSISAYDLKTTCIDCGYRGEFSDVCPKCGSTNIKFYGEDTTVYVDKENLAEGVNFTTDTGAIKNCFKLEAGDENMTAAVINCNPNGSPYIYYFSEEQKHDMSPELVAKINSYDELLKSYDKEYGTVMLAIYEAIDKIIYYTSEMMPKRENEPTDAKKEAAKLTELNLNPTSLPEVTISTSVATVNTAMKNYAKVFIHSGKYKVDVNSGEFAYEGTDLQGVNYGYWYGNFKLTNWGDEEDTALSPMIRVRIDDNFQYFLEQKIAKKLAGIKDEDGSIFDVLSIKDLNAFKNAITYYCLNRLISFNDAIQGAIDIMIEAGQAKDNSDLYNQLYVPYHDKLVACQAEIDKRKATIKTWETKLDASEKRQREIQKILDFEKYLGQELYYEFLCYKREDTYVNDNYISDGFENNEIFENAKMFLEVAKDELVKSGEHQHQISANMFNLLAMPEFLSIRDKFALGNFIRVNVDGKIYRLRLVSYEISFDEIQNINVEFSDVTKIKSGTTDLASVISKANNMASSYGAVANQVKSSKEQTDIIKNFVKNGLDATTMKIVNNADNQSITIDGNGLLARRKDEFVDTWEQFAIKLINNGLYFTDDGWRTVKAALGKYYYRNPDTGKLEVKYGLQAENIIGQLIIGEQLKLYSSDNTAEMSFDNLGLRLNAKKTPNGQYKRIFDIQKDGESVLYMDNQGNIVLAQNNFIDMIEKLDRLHVKHLDADNLYANTGTIVKFESEFVKTLDLSSPKGTITALTADAINAATAHFTGNIKTDLKILAAAGQIDNLTSTMGTINELSSFKATLDNLTTTLGTITTLNSDLIKTKRIEAGAIDFTQLNATIASLQTLTSNIATIQDLTAPVANISTLTVPTKATIEWVVSNLGNFVKLNADLAAIKDLKADIANLTKAVIPTLEVTTGTINNLITNIGTITTLNSGTITADKIIANTAEIKDLGTTLGDLTEIKAQVANIQSILAGSVGVGTLQAIHLTAKNVVIDKAVITDLIASQISVSDLKAGAIDTSKFNVTSSDGKSTWKDNTITINDAVRPRVQIGKDALGDYNMYVWDNKGDLMFDALGVTDKGIQRPIIRDDVVANDANINGNKLNINSVVTEINKDGTTTINSNKIWIDEEKQSLGVSFNQMKQSVNSSVETIVPYYSKSLSSTVAPVEPWTEVPPSLLDNEFLWRKEKIVKNDKTITWTNPYVLTSKNTSSIQIIVTSTNGTMFKKNSQFASTTLQCVVYKGEKIVTPNSYEWFIFDGSQWISLNKKTSSIEVSLTDLKDINRYKCVIDI